ncbi:MAG: hypothetical protein Q8P97_00045 [bacterium]|nr:hypothetical protein [bacterium]
MMVITRDIESSFRDRNKGRNFFRPFADLLLAMVFVTAMIMRMVMGAGRWLRGDSRANDIADRATKTGYNSSCFWSKIGNISFHWTSPPFFLIVANTLIIICY